MSDIENLTIYDKRRILELLEEKYTGEEFEILAHVSDMSKEGSRTKTRPFEIIMITGKAVIARSKDK